jgi:Fe-Mn family superoxide dismutase
MAQTPEVNPMNTLAAAISKKILVRQKLVTTFKSETKQFGSAWVWLVVDKSGKLSKVLKIKTFDEKRSYSGLPF